MRWIFSIFFGAVFVVIAMFIFIVAGGMPVATKGKALPLERLLAKAAIAVATRNESDRQPLIPISNSTLAAGAEIYTKQCAFCHGYTGEGPSALAKGMYPHPPQLLPPKIGVTDDPVGETYWKVKNGIRLTGMPAYDGELSEDELWQVSLFLSKTTSLPPGVLDSVHR